MTSQTNVADYENVLKDFEELGKSEGGRLNVPLSQEQINGFIGAIILVIIALLIVLFIVSIFIIGIFKAFFSLFTISRLERCIIFTQSRAILHYVSTTRPRFLSA